VHGEQTIEHLRRNEGVIWNGELNAHQDSFKAADDKKNQRITDVHQANFFVVNCRDPIVQYLQGRQTWSRCDGLVEDYGRRSLRCHNIYFFRRYFSVVR
jgi:hypothetical protein